MPAAVYIETHGGTGVGGSDDHAGVDIGRTWTETPPASTPEEFLRHVREGRAEARGEQGSAAKWAHSALALRHAGAAAARATERPGAAGDARSPMRCCEIAERVVSDGARARRRGSPATSGPRRRASLLRAWLDSVGLGPRPRAARALVELMQARRTSATPSSTAARAARHERRLREAVERASAPRPPRGTATRRPRGPVRRLRPGRPLRAGDRRSSAAEKAKLAARDGEPRRVALVVDAAGSMHGVTHTIERIREHGVPGFEVEVIGTDPRVDRRLPAVAEVEVPFYAGLEVGVPSLPELVETLADGRYDLVHLASPGPGRDRRGDLRADRGHAAGRQLPHRARRLRRDSHRRRGARGRHARWRWRSSTGSARWSSRRAPRPTSRCVALGIEPSASPAGPAASTCRSTTRPSATRTPIPGEVKVLYAGRLTKEKGVDLLADAFLRARERDPRLHLLLAGGGPEEDALRERSASARDGGDLRDLPRLARPRAAGRAPTPAPTCSCSARAPTPTGR